MEDQAFQSRSPPHPVPHSGPRPSSSPSGQGATLSRTNSIPHQTLIDWSLVQSTIPHPLPPPSLVPAPSPSYPLTLLTKERSNSSEFWKVLHRFSGPSLQGPCGASPGSEGPRSKSQAPGSERWRPQTSRPLTGPGFDAEAACQRSDPATRGVSRPPSLGGGDAP